MNKQKTISRGRKYHFKWGSLLLVALILGVNARLSSFQLGMTGTETPEVVLSDADASAQDLDLRDVDPPDPDLGTRDVDPPDPDLNTRDVDLRDADPPDPDLAP